MADLKWLPGQEGGSVQVGEAGLNPTWVENSGLLTYLAGITKRAQDDYALQQKFKYDSALEKQKGEYEIEKYKQAGSMAQEKAEMAARETAKREIIKQRLADLILTKQTMEQPGSGVSPAEIRKVSKQISELETMFGLPASYQVDAITEAIDAKDIKTVAGSGLSGKALENAFTDAGYSKNEALEGVREIEAYRKALKDQEKQAKARAELNAYKATQPQVQQQPTLPGVPNMPDPFAQAKANWSSLGATIPNLAKMVGVNRPGVPTIENPYSAQMRERMSQPNSMPDISNIVNMLNQPQR